MEEFDIYKDISQRTDGDIYIGVVGPVRSGKSTFIANFMEKLVLPFTDDENVKARMKDELPQSANGKAIMTTQPKFVPSEAAHVRLGENVSARIRLVDCVGYLIEGASGHMDGDSMRMVKTPWDEKEIPFEQAAEIGTKKVITDHSTIGIVMTSDGSIATDLSRKSYEKAEERAINELAELNKPFVVVLNSSVPESAETKKLADSLSKKYRASVIPLDVLHLSEQDITNLFRTVLLEFPLRDVDIELNKWMRALPMDNEIISGLIALIKSQCGDIKKMSDYDQIIYILQSDEHFKRAETTEIALGKGKICCNVEANNELFYQALSKQCEMEINDDFELIANIKELAMAKCHYDKLKAALDNVKETGYGVVSPSLDEMTLDEPEIFKQGSRYGVKLRASAPSLHIMRVDIESEVSPLVGTEQQSEELVKNLLAQFENDPKGIWQTNMFGKSLHMLVNEGLNNKLTAMPEDTQKKMRRTLSRIINEGKGGIICILL
ncbi:MAG: stage IV sporulation protein A [Clostridia bacterium]|nr:stage IV sporulation protein A [Clostridia bacterium]